MDAGKGDVSWGQTAVELTFRTLKTKSNILIARFA